MPRDAWIFIAAFALSSVAGLACVLRSPRRITGRFLASSLLNCGLMGLIAALLWYQYSGDNPYMLLGLCGLAGIGGVSLVDLVAKVVDGVVRVYAKERWHVDVKPDSETSTKPSKDVP